MNCLPEIQFRQESNEEAKSDFVSPGFYSPNFFDPTPSAMLCQKTSFSTPGTMPGFKNDELDDELNNLKKQFENNL